MVKQLNERGEYNSLPFLYEMIKNKYRVEGIEKRVKQLKKSLEEADEISMRTEIIMLESILGMSCEKFWDDSLIENVL